MEITGNIKYIRETVNVSENFKKRELVITTDEAYPQFISINFVQDKCDLLDKCKVGEEVKVSINLRGREWTNQQGETKYFNDIQGWRIESKTDSSHVQSEPETKVVQEDGHDDLPF